MAALHTLLRVSGKASRAELLAFLRLHALVVIGMPGGPECIGAVRDAYLASDRCLNFKMYHPPTHPSPSHPPLSLFFSLLSLCLSLCVCLSLSLSHSLSSDPGILLCACVAILYMEKDSDEIMYMRLNVSSADYWESELW